MKTTLIILITVILRVSGYAQQTTISVNDDVTFEVPSTSKTITREQALAHLDRISKNNKVFRSGVEDFKPSRIFTEGDVLISIFKNNGAVRSNQIELIKKAFDGMHKEDKSYSSSLTDVNGRPVLIVNYTFADVESYGFFAFNQSNTKSLTGTLQFPKSDHDKAKAILTHLTEKIKFKNE